ncbi:DUF1624 domain-containing protein [Pararhizobium haloflavum]|uniref:DUF1624 domain-containing protein n=1 Tax=Pararhizobium haloflavum TaxID=2037914 RepID=UPI001FE05C53|nr:DUF1624 domain-containing protein [Pararhizobium haloflavum]
MTDISPAASEASRSRRLIWLDVARGVALVAMAIYHFAWDLEFFGYSEPGTTGQGLWKLFARSIASSFLFLAGFSLVLGHYPTIRWRPFWKRFAMIVAAALAITIATWFATPSRFIFFGILHAIAAASLIGLAFLRLPPLLTIAAGVFVVVAPQFLRSAFFDAPIFWWVGLSSANPPSNDYVPLFPFFSPTLFGIALARILKDRDRLGFLAMNGEPSGPSRLLAFAGRHSLLVYLVHQPVLIACVYLFALVYPAPGADPATAYMANCTQSCASGQSEAFCTRFCDCTYQALNAQELFDDLIGGRLDPATDERTGAIASQCTADILGGQSPRP